jgi:hypothetical protein
LRAICGRRIAFILAIVAANMNLVSYIVLEKAKVMDPQRPRIIGVITKPDLVLTYNAREYVRVAKNQESAYKLLLLLFIS